MEIKPIRSSETSPVPGERVIDKPDHPPAGYINTKVAECEIVDGQLKVGRDGRFEVYCDEPPRIGGKDSHPQPLTYIAMGVGF